MHYFLYPTKDATITNQPNLIFKNTGLDEILEVEKTIQPKSCAGEYGPVISRTLIKFDLSDISASISNRTINNPKFTLNLKCVESNEVPIEYSVYSYPIICDWMMGTGYKFDGRTDIDGVNWKYSDNGITKWWPSSSLMDCSGGGVWLINSGSAQSGSIDLNNTGSLMSSNTFNYETSDIKMSVDNIVTEWLSGSIPNNGFILIHSGELDATNYGKLRFFSKETNTIYHPYLDISWDDSTFFTGSLEGTGSLNPINLYDAIISLPKTQKVYKSGNIVRMDVKGRKKYPTKTFTNKLSDYLEPEYLPENSFYSIKDAESEMKIIPPDEFTKLSCDGNGNYFMLDTGGLPQERYYTIEIHSEQSGSILTFASPLSFKISR